jgi:type I restriction enzyme S subunit
MTDSNFIKLKFIANSFSSSIKQMDVQENGSYPVYGASGQVGFLEIYAYDKRYIGIVKDGAGVGRTNIYEGFSSLLGTMSYIVPINETETNLQYLKYSIDALDLANTYGEKATIPHIYFSVYGNYKILNLSYEKQQELVDFLDKIVNKVDKLIANQQQQIEKLKEYKQSLISEVVTKGLNPNIEFKDSGIEWIGQIPKKWRVIRIKDFTTLKGRIGWQGLNTNDYLEEGPYLVTGTDFSNGNIDWNTCVHISEERYDEAPEIHLIENDLLITKDGTIGKVAIVKGLIGGASLNSGVLLIRVLDKFKFDKKFLYFVLQSDSFWIWYNSSQTGSSTIKHLYQNQFSYFSFAFPGIEEQSEISNYLHRKIDKVDGLISIKKEKIDKLNEFKKSLIYEYVTGKKEVS